MRFARKAVFLGFFLRSAFALAAAAVVIVALVIIAPRALRSLSTLRIAVAGGGEDAALAAGLAGAINKTSQFRLRVVDTSDAEAAAHALENGDADLAVVRGDATLPVNGLTVMVYHHDAAMVFGAPGRKLGSVADLAKKRVAVLPATAENVATFNALLALYSVQPTDVTRVPLEIGDIAAAVQARRIDAVVVIAPPPSPLIAKTLAALRAGGKGDISIADFPGAEGIAARHWRYRKVELSAGYFGAAPLLPKDDVTLLGFDYLLQARADLDETIVSSLTAALFETRRRVMSNLPAAAGLDKPEDEKTSVRALHPGAAAYYGDNAKSFMDRYGDWFYIGAMLLGGFGSALAGLLSLGKAHGRHEAMGLIDEIVALKDRAHAARDPNDLDTLDAELETLSSRGLRYSRDRAYDEAGLAALRLAIDEARRAIVDHRLRVAAASGAVTLLRPSEPATRATPAAE